MSLVFFWSSGEGRKERRGNAFLSGTLNYTRVLFQRKFYMNFIWSYLCPICTALVLSFFLLYVSPLFWRTNIVCKYFAPGQTPAPLHRFHRLCFRSWGRNSCECEVAHSDSHFPDSASDWFSPGSAIWLRTTVSCIPFSFFPPLLPSIVLTLGTGSRLCLLLLVYPS